MTEVEKNKIRKAKVGLIICGVLVVILAISSIPLYVRVEAFQNQYAQGEATIYPSDDAYTALDKPDNPHNFGLNVMNTHWDLGAGEYVDLVRWTWLKFDFADIPDGVIIRTATLKLRTLTVGLLDGPQKVSVYKCENNSWSEFTIIYSNQAEYSHVSMDSIIIDEPFLFYSWNVIDGVKNAIDGIHNKSDVVTFVLQEDIVHENDATGVNFYDKEGPELFRPRLKVEWGDLTAPTTNNDYDGLWQSTDFIITLPATDDLSGVNDTYYRINDGLVKMVSVDGQPLITTEGANNKLEYWSIDNAGYEETHHILTDIKLDKTKPTANAGQNQTVNVGTKVTFDASNSTDDVSHIISYEWDFGDGIAGTGITTTHTYTSPENYTVTLTVKDVAGNTATDRITITVNPAEAFPLWIAGIVSVVVIGTSIVAIFLWKRQK